MMQLHSYLTFNGNCREAMTFYQECLGGELSFQTIGESPLSKKMPRKMKESILHATLVSDSFMLMGSDMTPDMGLIKGNAVSLVLNCKSEAHTKLIFDKLSKGGTIEQPLENTYWGTVFGDLTDKFGNNWLLNYNNHSIII